MTAKYQATILRGENEKIAFDLYIDPIELSYCCS